MSRYVAAQYRNSDSLRWRWAVLDTIARVYYFPRHRGYRSAVRLARHMNCDYAIKVVEKTHMLNNF